MLSLVDLRFVLCSLEIDVHVLRAQRIKGFTLITHKSPKSEIVSHRCRCVLNLGCAHIHVSVRAWCLTFKFCPKYDYDRLSMPFIYLLNFQWLIAIPEKLVHMPRKQRHVCYTCTVHRNFMESVAMARVAVAIVLFSRTLHAFNMIGSVKSSWQIGHELPASAMSSLEGGEPYCCRKKVEKRNKKNKKKEKRNGWRQCCSFEVLSDLHDDIFLDSRNLTQAIFAFCNFVCLVIIWQRKNKHGRYHIMQKYLVWSI